MIPQYRDRFCPTINGDVYHLGEFSAPQTSPPSAESRLYSSFLTKTLLGFDPEEHPSIFSRKIQPVCHPLSLYPVSPLPAKPIQIQTKPMLDLDRRYIGAASGMEAIATMYSRPMTAKGGSSFFTAIGKIL